VIPRSIADSDRAAAGRKASSSVIKVAAES
jgi:hypothetical protein